MMSNTFMEKSLIYLLIIGSCIADPEIEYRKHGSSIIFVCPYRKESTHNVLWRTYNSGTLIPISDGEFIAESLIKDRVSIAGDKSAGEYNLELKHLQESDEEEYRCIVQHKEKAFKLELFAAPSSFNLQSETDNKIIGTEGQSLILRCTSTGGKPPPVVTISVENSSSSGIQSVEHVIYALQRPHDKQMVQCNASSPALTSPLVDTATLHLNLKPLQPVISPDPVSIEETKQLVVSCSSTGSRPAATFQWTIGQTDVTSYYTTQPTQNTADDTYTVTSVLKYNVKRTHNEQTITCSAVNIVDSSRTSRTLNVTFAPDITVNNATYDQSSDKRSMTCTPLGNPTTYTYDRWQHRSTNGELIRELDERHDGVLILPSVPVEKRYQDSGKYVCTARNGVADKYGKTAQSGSGYLIANAKPVFISGRNQTEFGEYGKDVDLYINVYSFPAYTSVKWYTCNTAISSTDKYKVSIFGAIVNDTFHGTTIPVHLDRVTLSVKNLTESDFNISYRVEVENTVGQSEYTILLVSASAPQTPVNFRAHNSTESSIFVQWEAGYNGGHEQTFYVEYRRFESNVWMRVKIQDSKQTGRHTYKLTGLQDGTLYELRMYAENKFNKSLPTQRVKLETFQAVRQASKMGPIIGCVAGGLTVVVIILIIRFVIFKRKQDTSTLSKNPRSRSDSDVPDGLQDNILYQSASSDNTPLVLMVESGKQYQNPSTSYTEYAEVQKHNAVYAEVDKTVLHKNVHDKKQKAGMKNQDGDYANAGMTLKDMAEREYANAEDKNRLPQRHKNQQGLEYADLSFTKHIPQKGERPVIHGEEDRTLYSEVDHTKKAPPPPEESVYEETTFKHDEQ